MKKYFAILLCIALMVCTLASCSEQEVTYNITDIATAIESVANIANPIEFSEDDLVYDMSLDMANVEEFTGTRTGANGSSGSVLVIKATAGNAETVKTQLEAYCANIAAFLGNYAEFADAQAQAEDGRVVMKGDYLVLAIAAEGVDYTAVDEAIDSAFQ